MVLAPLSVDAQIGNLKRAIKKEADKAGKKDTDRNDKAEKPENKADSSVSGKGQNDDGTVKSNSQAGFDPQYPPGVQFSSLLSGVVLHPNGELAIEIIATFLPSATSQKLTDAYNEVDGGKLEGIIKRADGSVHFQKRFRGSQRSGPFWRIYPVGGDRIRMSPGNYVLELYVEDELFYRFPFGVVNERSDDPFAKGSGDKLVLKGAWEEYAYLNVAEGDLAQPLYFKIWLRSPVKRGARIDVDIVSGGKVVARGGGEDQGFDLAIRWERRDIALRNLNGTALRGNEIFGKDGNYKAIVKIDGKLYGEYPFTVKGKKFVYLPEQRRAETDMTRFVEGGNDAFYVKKTR